VDSWLEWFCSSFFSFQERKMIDVGAVGISRSVRDFQTLWARSLRPQGVSVHIVSEPAKIFNLLSTGGTSVGEREVEQRGIPE
jgi:hypothetical protein